MKLLDLISERKERERRKQKLNTAKMVAAGSIIGAVTGMLLAPKSGKETRKDIADKTKEVKEATKKSINDSVNNAKEVSEKIKEEINYKVNEFKDRDMFEVDLNKNKVEVEHEKLSDLESDEEE